MHNPMSSFSVAAPLLHSPVIIEIKAMYHLMTHIVWETCCYVILPLFKHHGICLHRLSQLHPTFIAWCLWHDHCCIPRKWGVPRQCPIGREFWWGNESILFKIFLMSCLECVSHCKAIPNQTNSVVSYFREIVYRPIVIICFLIFDSSTFLLYGFSE